MPVNQITVNSEMFMRVLFTRLFRDYFVELYSANY